MINRKMRKKVPCRVGGGRVVREILFAELTCELKPESWEGKKAILRQRRDSVQKVWGRTSWKSERPDKCDHSTMCLGRRQKPDITLQVKGFWANWAVWPQASYSTSLFLGGFCIQSWWDRAMSRGLAALQPARFLCAAHQRCYTCTLQLHWHHHGSNRGVMLLECVTQKPGCSAPILSSSARMTTHSSPLSVLPEKKVRVDITAEMNSGYEIPWDQQVRGSRKGREEKRDSLHMLQELLRTFPDLSEEPLGQADKMMNVRQERRVQKPGANWVEINKLWLPETLTECHCPEVEISLGNRKASQPGVRAHGEPIMAIREYWVCAPRCSHKSTIKAMQPLSLFLEGCFR